MSVPLASGNLGATNRLGSGEDSARKMKLAVVTSFPHDAGRPHGGVEAVSINLVRALARRPEWMVEVVTLDRKNSSPTIQDWEGARIHRLPAPGGWSLLEAVGKGRRLVEAYLTEMAPDVVHAHDTYGIMVQHLSLPRVFTIHGFIYEDTLYGGGFSAWVRSRLWRRIELAGWASQPHIISISPYVRERLRGLTDGRIHDIENPISESCFDVQPRRGGRVIFSAAVICQRKNTLGLVEAFARFIRASGPAQLRLAGPIGDDEYGRQVMDLIQRHGLGDDVVLLGSIGAAAVREELARADLFALLSYEEGAPMGIAEAMAAGLPVVTTNRCGMPYMVRHGETGFLVQPDDSDGAADCFRQILDLPGRAAELGTKARAMALDRFHPDRVAERTCAVYRQALARFHRRAD